MATRKVVQVNHYNINKIIMGDANNPRYRKFGSKVPQDQAAVREIIFNNPKITNWLPFTQYTFLRYDPILKKNIYTDITVEYWYLGPLCLEALAQMDTAVTEPVKKAIRLGYCCEPRAIGYPIFIQQNENENINDCAFYIGKTGMFEMMEESFQNVNDQKEDDEGILIPNEIQIFTPNVYAILIPKGFYKMPANLDFGTKNNEYISSILMKRGLEYKLKTHSMGPMDQLDPNDTNDIFEFTLTLLFENQNTT